MEHAGEGLREDGRVGLADHFPEGLQLVEPFLRPVAGDEGRIHGADRYTGDPVAADAGAMHAFIDSRLVGAKGAAALQHQGNCFVIELHGFFRHGCLPFPGLFGLGEQVRVMRH